MSRASFGLDTPQDRQQARSCGCAYVGAKEVRERSEGRTSSEECKCRADVKGWRVTARGRGERGKRDRLEVATRKV